MSPRNRVSLLLSAALVILGVASIVRTASAGASGVAVGYIFGVALVLAGAGRGWLALHMERRD
ncbi:MAG: hypothetical protein QOI71_1316 [Gaiellales bacterium]|jgi:hypothetical protein|nr:hypothetical protein [Gaiellales bacterium]MDX6620230.1 hypothetical protein [Gaiellales bacterium]